MRKLETFFVGFIILAVIGCSGYGMLHLVKTASGFQQELSKYLIEKGI